MSSIDGPRLEIPESPNWDQLSWSPQAGDVADNLNLGFETLTSCLHTPQRRNLDAQSAEKGYPVVRYIRGDVMVIVGFQEGPEWPYVLGVYRISENKHGGSGSKHHSTAGMGAGSTVPKSYRQLTSAIQAMGYRVKPGRGSGHPHVETQDGVFVYTLPATASDHRSLPNSWAGFLRAAQNIPPTPDEPEQDDVAGDEPI